jgi:hypothetical protein
MTARELFWAVALYTLIAITSLAVGLAHIARGIR